MAPSSQELEPPENPGRFTLRPERGGRLGSDASQRQQQGRWRWHAGARLRPGEPGIPLGLDSLDLFDQELEPVELPSDLGLQAIRKRATIAGDQLLKPAPDSCGARARSRRSLGR